MSRLYGLHPWHVGGDAWLTWGELRHYSADLERVMAEQDKAAR